MGLFSNIFGSKLFPVFLSTTTSDSNDSAVVSVDNATKISTVYSCINIISEDAGTLPTKVKYRKGEERITDYTHPIARLLNEPNPQMGGINFRVALIYSLCLRGNAYAHISQRDSLGYPSRLDILNADEVTPISTDDALFYNVDGFKELIPSRDIIHIRKDAPDGILGRSPITSVRDTFENARNMTRFSKNIYKRDLRSTAVFQHDGKLSADAYSRLKEQLTKAWARLGKSAQPLVLEEGTKVSTLAITPDDAQFIETKLQTIDEIAAIFKVPPHKVGDWTRGTYSNNTQANLEYCTDCLRPILEMIEEELNRKLFLESEKGIYYIDINEKALLRLDNKAQMETFRIGYNMGVYSPNEIRKMLDLPRYEGGDRYFVPVNLAENGEELKPVNKNE